VQIFDVETEQGFEHTIELKILKDINCLSQCCKNNHLYLCGTDVNDKDVNYGSYLFKYNSIEQRIQMLVSSTFTHYKPAMIFYFEDIVIVGGRDSKKCEKMCISDPKWDPLPDLPEV
jgi:hypothetical protein